MAANYRVWYLRRGEPRWEAVEAPDLDTAISQSQRRHKGRLLKVVPIARLAKPRL